MPIRCNVNSVNWFCTNVLKLHRNEDVSEHEIKNLHKIRRTASLKKNFKISLCNFLYVIHRNVTTISIRTSKAATIDGKIILPLNPDKTSPSDVHPQTL